MPGTITELLVELSTSINGILRRRETPAAAVPPAPPRQAPRRGRRKPPGGWEDPDAVGQELPTLFDPQAPVEQPHVPPRSRHIHGAASASEALELAVEGTAPVLDIFTTAFEDIKDFDEAVGSKAVSEGLQGVAETGANILSLAGAAGSAGMGAHQVYRAVTDEGMSRGDRALTILEATERLTLATARGTGSVMTQVTHHLNAASSGVATVSAAGGGISSGVSIVTSTIQLYSGIQEAMRRTGVRATSIALLALLDYMQDEKIRQDSFAHQILKSEASKKRYFIEAESIPLNLSPYYWFCFKYHRTMFGEVRSAIERLAIPLITLAAGILGVIMIATSVASGGIALIVMGGVAAAAGLAFAGYRFGKYFQSEKAFQDLLSEPRNTTPLLQVPGLHTPSSSNATIQMTEKEKAQLSACLTFKHRFVGRVLKKFGSSNVIPGATLGDWFRFKLSQDLLDLCYKGGLDDPDADFATGFSQEPQFRGSRRYKDEITQGIATDVLKSASDDIQNLMTRGVWETIKSDVSEHSWRASLAEITVYMDQYTPIRDLIERSERSGQRSRRGASAAAGPDYIFAADDIPPELIQKMIDIETKLLKVFFSMIRVNA